MHRRALASSATSRPWAALLVLAVPLLAGCLAPAPGTDDGTRPLAADVDPAALGPTTYERVGEGMVRIHRDGFGVPHIYADTEEALFWGEGFAQAQDRLWQMEVYRRAATGRLAEVLGEEALALDIQMRHRLGSEDQRWRIFDLLPPGEQAAFEAFADGVNAFLAAAMGDPVRRMPAEMGGLVVAPEPWTVTDSLAVAQLMFGVFGESGGREAKNAVLLTDLEARFGEAAAWAMWNDLSPLADMDAPPSIPPEELAYPAPATQPALPEAQRALLTPELIEAARRMEEASVRSTDALHAAGLKGWGSNAILLAGRHTASGAPMLLGGPQTGYSTPAIFWEGALHGAGFDVDGVMPPGLPGIAIGRTATFAWSVTSGDTDLVDVVVEELHPQDPTMYRVGDGWARMGERVETFLVRNAQDPAEPPGVHVATLRDTRHGSVEAVTEDGRFALVRATALTPESLPGTACWLRLGAAKGYPDYEACLQRIATTFNFHYADTDGRIAYHHVGHVPLRAPGFDPRFPIPGWGPAEWRGTLPWGAMPHVVDPASGWLANWNNSPARGWPKGDGLHKWGLGNRNGALQAHIAEAIAAKPGALTLDDLQAVNEVTATRALFAPAFAPFLAEAPSSPARDAMLAWMHRGAPIRDDDADGQVDDPAATAFEAFIPELTRLALADELGGAAPVPRFPAENWINHDGHAEPEPALLLRALRGHASRDWADDATTPDARERAAELVARALDVADATLASGEHPMRSMVFNGYGAGSAPAFPRMNRGSYNLLAELTTPIRARSVLAPGQSGLVTATAYLGLDAAAHATDQMVAYQGFDTKPVPFAVPEVEALAEASADLRVVRGVQVPERLPVALADAMRDAGLPGIGLLGRLSS